MKIPKKFQLGPHQWTVKHVDGMVIAADGDECRGLCDYDTLTISVNVAQAPSMVMHTFMHEVLHAVLWTCGSEKSDDEGFVDSVGGALTQVLMTGS